MTALVFINFPEFILLLDPKSYEIFNLDYTLSTLRRTLIVNLSDSPPTLTILAT